MSTLEERSQAVIDGIETIDPEFVLHLPSSTLKIVLDHFLTGPGVRTDRLVFPIPREEEGISILSGLSLARRPQSPAHEVDEGVAEGYRPRRRSEEW